ncbi:MAG: dienelactone hydrolase family protein [Ktedonobacterales bacterium]
MAEQNYHTVDGIAGQGIHANQLLHTAGTPLPEARAALILLHGRGASAADILTLGEELGAVQAGIALLTPQAHGGVWYPVSFLAPLTVNEPWLSDALVTVGKVYTYATNAGIPGVQIALLGFSQGACLALEYAARNASSKRFGAVVGLSGGLIGPDETPRDYPGSLAGTQVFLGCSVPDFHIPEARVRQSAEVFEQMGASVTMRHYPNMGHTVNADELALTRVVLARVADA